MSKDNIHEGHRERLIQKFLAFPDSLSEHELLEILLFYSIPRADTNVIAHKLIKAFGGLYGVFNATAEQLMQVEGVGKRTASNIALNKILIDRFSAVKEKAKPLFNYKQTLEYLQNYYEDYEKESSVIMFFDRSQKLIVTLPFSELRKTKISAEIPELTNAINAFKPSFAVMSHTHPSGNSDPSEQDDYSTTKFMLVCNLNGITLLDHIILAKDSVYSYFHNGRFDLIKRKAEVKLFI